MSKGIPFSTDTRILIKNWIISFANRERFATNIFKFDPYRGLGIQQYADNVFVISFELKTAYNDWFPFKRFS